MTDRTSDPQPPVSDLRAASDLLLQRMDRLYELEARKRELPPDEPEFVRVAREVEDVARGILGATGMQVELADQVAAAAKRGVRTAKDPIREVPPLVRDAMTILTDWRAAERRLAAAAPGSRDELAARADVERLRHEYRRRMNEDEAGGPPGSS
jgi:hypothetical protein